MNCRSCGGPLKTNRENYTYRECGLDDVHLVNVEVRHCEGCGKCEPVLGRLPELHGLLARHLALKRSLLTGKEIRFLRKYLGHSGTDYARHVGVAPETVSRWENEKQEMGWTNEMLLRVSVLLQQRVTAYPPKVEAETATESPLKSLEAVNRQERVGPERFQFKPENDRWLQVATA